MKIRDVEIMDIDEMESVLEEHKIDIGIICVPRKNAQVVADELIRGGVRAIWNFCTCRFSSSRSCESRKCTSK